MNHKLGLLGNVLDRLRALSYGTEPRRLWWIAGGTIEAVREGALDASVAVKLLFGAVDREIRRYAEQGENGFIAQPPRDLVKNLLYYVAHSTAQGDRASEVRATYRLDALLPTQKELQHAQGSMTCASARRRAHTHRCARVRGRGAALQHKSVWAACEASTRGRVRCL